MSERTFQFDAFELQEHSGELRKHGRIRIQEQPFQILLLLLDRPGEIVGREEIRAKLWPENTFVDFDNAISSAVRKLREALSDSADNPRFIETLARRGYRFIGPIAPQPQALPMPPPKRTRTKAAAIVAGTLLILGVTSWWLWPRPKPATVQLAPLPLTAAAGLETEPSFSPDGNQIAYAWDETGARNDSHIYVKLIGSGRPVQLTSGANADSYPAWSPDGRAIAFVRALGQGNAIYWIPPVGGAERKLADGYFDRGISWSPDGKFLAIAERQSPNGLPSLYRIAVENGERLRLTTPPDARPLDGDPVFSPDGRTLLFTRCRELSTCGLYLLDLSPDYRPRAEPRLLKQEDVPISGAAWTVDGREVVYALSSGDFWSYQLRRIRVEAGAQPERLSYAGERVSMPAIARSGNRLAYQQSLEDTDVWRIEPGKPARSFLSSTRHEYAAQYSPDGTRVVFSSDRSGQTEIWTCNADGGNLTQLTDFAEHSGTPRWSLTGVPSRSTANRKEGWHIFVIASDGGQPRRLTSDERDEVIPSWSRDGNWIYYASNRTRHFEIWKAPAKGGKAIQVTRNGGWTAFESYDGKSLYYTKDPGDHGDFFALWELPVQGGQERLVLESVGSRAFVVMDDGIYYVPGPAAADGNASVRFHDFATGKNRQITSLKGFAGGWGGLTVSPDRKTFLFLVRTRTGSNVMVVDNFR